MWERISKILWTPIRHDENWAQTLIRVSGNLLRWVIAFPLLLTAVAFGWWITTSWFEQRPRNVIEFDDITIGMSPTDVTLLKGAPDFITNEGGTFYKFGTVWVIFGLSQSGEPDVVRICEMNPYSFRMLNGIKMGNKEKRVQKHLGEPDEVTISEDGLSQWLWYGKYNTGIQLSKARVTAFCIGGNEQTDKSSYNDVWSLKTLPNEFRLSQNSVRNALTTYRSNHPNVADYTDAELIEYIRTTHYSDMKPWEFYQKITLPDGVELEIDE